MADAKNETAGGGLEVNARGRNRPTLDEFLDEVERHVSSYTRQAENRVLLVVKILRDGMEIGSIDELAHEDFEDRFKRYLGRLGLTDSQKESRQKGFRSILRYGGDEKGYFQCPEFGPLRMGPGKRGPLKGHSGREHTVADLHRLWTRLERGKESFAGGRIRITVCMVGFVGLSLEASLNLCQSQIVDGGTGITYESRYHKGTRHKFLSREIAQILAEWLGNPELRARSPLSSVGDRWIVLNNRGDGPWDRDSNPPEHPLGHLESACAAEGIERMTFEDIHVLHKNHKIKGPRHLADLARRGCSEGEARPDGARTPERRPSVLIGAPHEPVKVFDVDQGVLPRQLHAVLKTIRDSNGRGVGVDELRKVVSYPRDRIRYLKDRSPELDRLITRTDAHAGSKVLYNFSQWWLP